MPTIPRNPLVAKEPLVPLPDGVGQPSGTGVAFALDTPLARWRQRVGSMLIDAIVLGIPLAVLDAVTTAAFGTRHITLQADGFHVGRSLQGPSLLVTVLVLTA